MKRTVALALLGISLTPFIADAQDNTGSRRFEACVWPNRCGPGPKVPTAPKPEPAQPGTGGTKEPAKTPAEPIKEPPKAVPNLSMPTDPLGQAILQRRLAGESIVSAVRLKKEDTGWKEDQIVYNGKPDLRDALAPKLGLPGSAIPKAKKDAKDKDAAQEEWAKIDSTAPAAAQANKMREERPALSGTGAESKEGMDRMWGDKSKSARADK